MTNDDKFLDNLFADFNPDLGGEAPFMATLNKKLEAVEYLRQRQQAQLHRYRMFIVLTLVLGVVCGAVLFALILAMPADLQLFHFGLQTLPLVFLEHNGQMILLILFATLLAIGTLVIVNNLNDLHELRERR